MILLGLTGSIGMGKSTTAAMFAAAGVPVYDSDVAVHELYGVGGAAAPLVEAAFPGVLEGGAVRRDRLSERVMNDPEALKRLESIVHPLVGRHRQNFFERTADEKVVVLDVPLLFETGGDEALDAVAVVSCPPDQQRERVLARPGMSIETFNAILKRQMPDADKRARADFVIETGLGLDVARAQVRTILAALADPRWRSSRPRRDPTPL
jgi:dephospho-CoA kinase